jgi:regulator of protease activity HflC (stomatin/prohibitin superfamily)
VDLPDAAITTKCGKSMIISANVGYKIVDLPKLWTTICNSNETIRNLAIGFLASECSEMTWDELQENRRELETRLTKHLHDELATCGLDINRVQLTDFVQTRMYRVFGNGTKVT